MGAAIIAAGPNLPGQLITHMSITFDLARRHRLQPVSGIAQQSFQKPNATSTISRRRPGKKPVCQTRQMLSKLLITVGGGARQPSRSNRNSRQTHQQVRLLRKAGALPDLRRECNEHHKRQPSRRFIAPRAIKQRVECQSATNFPNRPGKVCWQTPGGCRYLRSSLQPSAPDLAWPALTSNARMPFGIFN